MEICFKIVFNLPYLPRTRAGKFADICICIRVFSRNSVLACTRVYVCVSG